MYTLSQHQYQSVSKSSSMKTLAPWHLQAHQTLESVIKKLDFLLSIHHSTALLALQTCKGAHGKVLRMTVTYICLSR